MKRWAGLNFEADRTNEYAKRPMKMGVAHRMDTVKIDVTMARWVTDELATAFFECPACNFSRVPYVGLPYPDLNQEDRQTCFCPGCGVGVAFTHNP